jgi:uncharacterized protein (DUF1778 family)
MSLSYVKEITMSRMSGAILSVRLDGRERDVLAHAAERSRTTISDFVRRRAVEAAEMELFHAGTVVIAAADWERFEAWTQEPPREKPELRRLAHSKPVWQV